jgi:hypothetical protein
METNSGAVLGATTIIASHAGKLSGGLKQITGDDYYGRHFCEVYVLLSARIVGRNCFIAWKR